MDKDVAKSNDCLAGRESFSVLSGTFPHDMRLPAALLAPAAFFLCPSLPGAVLGFGPWSGGVTHEKAEIIAKLPVTAQPGPDEGLKLELSASESFEESRSFPTLPQPLANPSPYIRRFTATGLKPSTTYYYRVSRNGAFDPERLGTFTTTPAPGTAHSFSFTFGSCSKTGSDSPVYLTMKGFAPLFFLQTGDLHYEDVKSLDIKAFRSCYQRVWSSPTQAAFYRSTPIAYTWDDHDFTGNGSAGGSPNARVVYDAYLENAPHHTILAPATEGLITQRFEVGRVLFLMLDCRAGRSSEELPDNASKTMLGAWQKKWFKDELSQAKERPLVFVVSSVSWVSPASDKGDNWGRYTTERTELSNHIKKLGLKNLCFLSGDAHMLAADDGANNQYAEGGGPGFPCLQAAPLDKNGSIKGGPWSVAPIAPGPEGGSQFGVVRVTDSGQDLKVLFQGMDQGGTEKMRLEFTSPGK